MAIPLGAAPALHPRDYGTDRPFLIGVRQRQTGATPFFLMWVDNAELMKAHP